MSDPTTIESIFSRLIAKAETRESEWAEELAAITEGPCPQCGSHGSPIQRDASVENSAARNLMSPLFELCGACQVKDEFKRKMERWGVPAKVLDASFENYEIYDDRQRKVLPRAEDFVRNGKHLAFFSGTSGTGKGHLTSSIIRAMSPRSAYWTTHSGLFTKLWANDLTGQSAMLDRLASVPLLVIDEMGTKAPSPETREKFYYLVNERCDQSLKTIMLANIPYERRPKDGKAPAGFGLIDYFPRMAFNDRFMEVGEIFTCRWASNRTR